MVSLTQAQTTNTALTSTHPLVAVFIGGTSGIGASSVLELSRTHGTTCKGLRLYLVGRNQISANELISECVKLCPTGEFIFVKAEDLALLKDVDRVCEEIIRIEGEKAGGKGEQARIDMLIMTQAIFVFDGERQETSEGLDSKFPLLYYSRIRAINQLLSLLLHSPLPAV